MIISLFIVADWAAIEQTQIFMLPTGDSYLQRIHELSIIKWSSWDGAYES